MRHKARWNSGMVITQLASTDAFVIICHEIPLHLTTRVSHSLGAIDRLKGHDHVAYAANALLAGYPSPIHNTQDKHQRIFKTYPTRLDFLHPLQCQSVIDTDAGLGWSTIAGSQWLGIRW